MLLSFAAAAAPPAVPAPPPIDARAYLLQDFHSGRVLAEKNADERMEPASLTKMMTVYVVFSELEEGHIALSDKVHVSEKAWKTPGSRMFIEVGSEVSVEDLLKGDIVQSGNDASVALAEYVAGSEASFAEIMNQYASRLGMNGSHFVNATGLPADGHYTTARDMATIAQALIRDFPDFYKLFSIKQYTYNGITQYNRNRLLWSDESVDGLKTGYTESAGYNLVSSASRDEMRLVSVVMGAGDEKARVRYSQSLLGWGFRFFETHRLYAAKQPLTRVRVWKGELEDIGMGLQHDLWITVPRGQYDKLSANLEVDKDIVAPVHEGETHGTVKVTLGDSDVTQRPLVALQSVAEGSLWQRLSDHVRLMFQ